MPGRDKHPRIARSETRRTWAVTALKIVSLLSLIRVYDIVLVGLAQYLSCIFFFTRHAPDFSVLTDPGFFILVVCTWMCVAAGYIINFFYDKNKDRINAPQKGSLDGYVTQSTTLKLYLTLNAAAIALSLYVSPRSVVFFAGFAFLLWCYSHKLKKLPLLSNLFRASLTVVPIFAVFFYRKVVEVDAVFWHGAFLLSVLTCLSLLNDLNNRRGDAACGYRTLPVVRGERYAALAAAIAAATAAASSVAVAVSERDNAFFFYFVSAGACLAGGAVVLAARPGDGLFRVAYAGIKLLILLGLLCIPLRTVPV